MPSTQTPKAKKSHDGEGENLESNMRFNIYKFATLMILLGFAGMTLPAFAQSPTMETIAITDAWTRVTPPGAKVAAGFLTITNNGKAPITLTGASVEISPRVEIHSMTMEMGMMKMRELTEGLEIKPGSTVTLKPGGYHLMFMNLTESPKKGGTVSGKLVFKDLGNLDVSYDVQPLGTKSMVKESSN